MIVHCSCYAKMREEHAPACRHGSSNRCSDPASLTLVEKHQRELRHLSKEEGGLVFLNSGDRRLEAASQANINNGAHHQYQPRMGHLKRTTLMREEKRTINETLAFATTTPSKLHCAM